MKQNRIRKYRIREGLSQGDLAKMIGTSKQMISHWECQNRQPNLEHGLALAKALGVDPNTLIYDDGLYE